MDENEDSIDDLKDVDDDINKDEDFDLTKNDLDYMGLLNYSLEYVQSNHGKTEDIPRPDHTPEKIFEILSNLSKKNSKLGTSQTLWSKYVARIEESDRKYVLERKKYNNDLKKDKYFGIENSPSKK